MYNSNDNNIIIIIKQYPKLVINYNFSYVRLGYGCLA